MRKFSAAFAVSLWLCSLASAAPFNVPNIPDGEVREFSIRREAQKRDGLKEWSRASEALAGLTIKTTWKNGPEGREMIVHRDELRAGGHRCFFQFRFVVKENRLITSSYSEELKTADGRMLRNESARMWAKDGNPPADMLHIVALADAARGMEFRPGAKAKFQVWVPDGGNIPQGILTVHGLETVKVPAGTYKAWKVKMEFDLSRVLKRFKGLEFLVNLVVPKFIFWFADVPSKPLIKYSGQFAGAPIEFQELSKITGNSEIQ